MKTSLAARALLALSLLAPIPAHAGKPSALPDHWVGTWATAPYAFDNTKSGSPLFAADTTLRQIVHTSLAGPLVRVELTNRFGTEPLIIAATHIALAGGSTGDIALPSANALTFGGLPSVTIPPGASVISDPAALNLPAESDLAISLFLPAQQVSHVTFHGAAYQTNFLLPGNVVGQKSLPTGGRSIASWYFLKAVDVQTPGDTGAVVVLGDSITDGAGSTLNANSRWPDLLAHRLHADKKTRHLAVLNEGIGGNRILHDNTGPNALARFDADVLALSGVRFLIFLEGINDIGHAADPKNPYDIVSAQDLIQGLTLLTERAHAHGIKVIGATLTPYVGAGYSSPAGEAMRKQINAWIRSSKLLDGVIDFDDATRDPSNPDKFRESFQRGDFLHPNDAGYKAMANAINLKLFVPAR